MQASLIFAIPAKQSQQKIWFSVMGHSEFGIKLSEVLMSTWQLDGEITPS